MNKRTLVLVGSGEFTPAMESVDGVLLNSTGSEEPKIAILPTAAGKEHDYDKWIKMGEEHFKKLGGKPLGIHVIDKQGANKYSNIKLVEEADIIYFSGGDPQYLYDTLNDSKLLEAVMKKYNSGTILVGSSAGAMIMGSKGLLNVYSAFEHGTPPGWNEALGLVNCGIIPHYDGLKKDYADLFQKIMDATPATIDWIGIDEDTALILENNKQKVLGKGVVHFKKPTQKIIQN